MRFACSAMLLILAGERAGLFAQAPSFDVASIKPTVAAASDGVIQTRVNGRLDATNTSLRRLIFRAYALHESQLIGAPDWTATERFDVDARVDSTPPGGPEALMPMLRTLLAERFGLRVHTEMRELPAFVLTVARRDGRLGPQIRPTEADCTKPNQLTVDQIRAQVRDGWPPCGMGFTTSFVDANDVSLKTRIRRSGVSMNEFATMLQANVDRPVVDRTRLEGLFDVEYAYAQPGSNAAVDLNQPLLLVALEEQLGLKLSAQRTMVPVLVVDSVDRPIEN